MDNHNHFSELVNVFHGRIAPEEGFTAGYAALIERYRLSVPLPDRLALISRKRRQYTTDQWIVLTPRHTPDDSLYGHLAFALKYEGVDLAILKKLFEATGPTEIAALVSAEPTGQYSRRIWFLYEWLTGSQLPLPDAAQGNYVDLLDGELQFTGAPEPSRRHRVRNNLPGVRDFCPLVRKTPELKKLLEQNLSQKIRAIVGKIHPDVMARTAAFLLLKDSKASYAIEGEHPPQNRIQRWGRAIAQAGQRSVTQEELLRLQQIVIDNARFTKMGWRRQGGFVGEHDRRTGAPLPDHISARWEDVPVLIEGLIEANNKLEGDTTFDAVIAAAMISFGFVFTHPLVDGNGRLHRYLIHHVLVRKHFAPREIVFPVSAVMLERLEEYRKVLEHFSLPRLDLIEWSVTDDNNVEVTNDTIDLYRYFDATRMAEFLYACVQHTAEKTVPEEVVYLEKYDRMKTWIDQHFEMPDRLVALLVRFLEQGNGKLSTRAKSKEFKALTPEEVERIENKFREIF